MVVPAPTPPRSPPKNDASSTIVGNHRIWRNVKGANLSEARDVIVWLPPGYDENPDARYPVLYMHDGRQVFDPATSTWGKDWRVDDVAQELIPAGKMAPCIVVASDCTARRNEEYGIGPEGEAYEAWLVGELKPAVDAAFRTDPARNAVAGASMGGLISFLIAWRRPDVFQAAGVLSPAFGSGFRGRESFTSLVKRFLDETPVPGNPPLLFVSCGDGDPLEKDLLLGTEEIVAYLRSKGFPEEKIVRRFPLHGEPHNEESWSHLVPEFLPLFFPSEE